MSVFAIVPTTVDTTYWPSDGSTEFGSYFSITTDSNISVASVAVIITSSSSTVTVMYLLFSGSANLIALAIFVAIKAAVLSVLSPTTVNSA